MHNIIILSFLLTGLFATVNVQAQARKIDTTASFGNASYRVKCTNKNESENEVLISPKGFKEEVRDVSITIRGQLRKILVDDLNDDGYPDLLLCVYGGANGEIGNIIGIASSGNTSLTSVQFPDIYRDPKLRQGYEGHDEFTILVGTLQQSFPIYKSGDAGTPIDSTRVIQYKIVNGNNGGQTFKVLRSYEKKG
ncbi:MAG TPA: hypothetical protein VH396_11360 [Chitinophagaceae bacterium]|jgi:hypothetical protein